MKLTRTEVYPAGTPHGDSSTAVALRASIPPEHLGESYWFWCPGCETHHSFRTRRAKEETRKNRDTGKQEKVPVWTFNGNLDKPSFTPSLLIHGYRNKKGQETGRCHLFLTDGIIKYQGDCSHKLAGKEFPLPNGHPFLLGGD